MAKWRAEAMVRPGTRWNPQALVYNGSPHFMVELTREVRCFLTPLGAGAANLAKPPHANTWAGWPSAVSVTPFVVVRCSVQGEIDPETDYLCNVKWLDEIVRDQVVQSLSEPIIVSSVTPAALLTRWFATIQAITARTPRLHCSRLQLSVSPYLRFEIDSSNSAMIRITHEYEFSASHRLHNPAKADEDNRRLYGKCNHPHGHGHNYVLQVTWQTPTSAHAGEELENWDAIVKRVVIDRLDHRYLNVEVSPFDQVNPTVENIAVSIWQWLAPEFDASAALHNVRVYETPKTWADFNAHQ